MHTPTDIQTLREELSKLEAEFERNGGRGVELAELIDNLRLVIAQKEAV